MKMFIKSDIRKVTIALKKSLGHELYVRLGKAGLIHLARLQTGDISADAGMAAEEAKIKDILAAGSFVLKALGLEAGEGLVSENKRDAERDAVLVVGAKKTLERLQRLRVRIQEKAALVDAELGYDEALDRMGFDPGVFKKVSLVRAVLGQTPEVLPDLPENESFVIASTGRYVVGAALPQALPRMLEFLKKHDFVDKTIAISGTSVEGLKRRAAVLQGRLDFLNRYTEVFKKEKGPSLLALHHSCKVYEEVLKAMRQSAFSAKAIFITGWLDVREKPGLMAILREICGECFIVSFERDPNAPVRLMNLRLFKPFELIVRIMGMPSNSEIDPTPLAALVFVLIFGLMFGDLGQGLVLAVCGGILKSIAGRRKQEAAAHAGGILMACGLSAAFCGVLYGSLFSSEHLIPALWIRPAEDIMGLFSFTVLLGAVVIGIGLCISILNAFLNRDYPAAFLDKKGLAVLILYSAIVLMAVRYATHSQAPAFWEIGFFIFLPLLVFSLRGFIGPVLFKVKAPHDLVEYVTETVMEMVEIALSLFANTLSFIRVGAFALSHAGLSIVTYTLAGMVDPALKTPGAVAMIVFGNIIIIGFEGLICGIQSMRLEYYEFFSKFYRGDGVEFSPFVLKTRIQEV